MEYVYNIKFKLKCKITNLFIIVIGLDISM